MHTFETVRLLMRPLQPEDEAFYCACYTDPVLMRHIGELLTHEAALRSFKVAFKANSKPTIRQHTWVMQDTQSHSDIGLLGLACDHGNPEPVNAQIGAIILDEFQNRGFAAEAISALVDIAFKLTSLCTLSTQHELQNASANGLMEKLGFQRNPSRNGEKTSWLLSRADYERDN